MAATKPAKASSPEDEKYLRLEFLGEQGTRLTDQADPACVLWRADDPDVSAVQAAFGAGIGHIAPGLLNPAIVQLQRLARPNWTMEWYLPRWLGEALGLKPDAWRSLMLANVFGLTYVRLQDDLADGEAGELPREALPLLATALYSAWTGEYVTLFGREPAFWERFQAYLSQWIGATLSSNRAATGAPAPLSPEGKLALAHRGAPLKICCAGACLLAGRPWLIGDLEIAVDHLLTAAVLLDHVADWAADLEAGRYNAFVAYASPLPQDSDHREENRRRVMEELYGGQTARPYYAAIREEIGAARRTALAIPCEGLADFLAWLDAETIAAGERLAAAVAARVQAVVAVLFGPDTTQEAVER